MDLFFFRGLLQEYGFDLIKHYSDVYYRDETGIPKEECLKNNDELSSIYSGCWFGSYFFKWLFDGKANVTNSINKNKITHCSMTNKYEEHHFCIISNDDIAIIFNTYGGVKDIVIVTRPLEEVNNILFGGEELDILYLFGVEPSYQNTTCEELCCEELPLELPSKQGFIEKMKELIPCLYTEDDKNYLLNVINSL